MNTELMTELLALPRGRWMILRQGLPQALSAALGDKYKNHTRIETPEGPLRVLRMGRVRVADCGGSYDVYALCNMRQAPANPYWDPLGRLVVDRDTWLVELDRPQAVTPMAAWGSDREREETLAELRELRAEREELVAAAADAKRRYEDLRASVAKNADRLEAQAASKDDARNLAQTVTDMGVALESLEEELDELKTDAQVGRDLIAMAFRQMENWPSRSSRVVLSLLSSALKSLDGER